MIDIENDEHEKKLANLKKSFGNGFDSFDDDVKIFGKKDFVRAEVLKKSRTNLQKTKKRKRQNKKNSKKKKW